MKHQSGHNNGTSVSRRTFLRRVVDTPQPSAPAPHVSLAAHCLAQAGVSCRLCEDICGPRAIGFRPQTGGHYHPHIAKDMCTGCLQCVDVCPVGALQAHEGPHHA